LIPSVPVTPWLNHMAFLFIAGQNPLFVHGIHGQHGCLREITEKLRPFHVHAARVSVPSTKLPLEIFRKSAMIIYERL
jgi:hypothetical protein